MSHDESNQEYFLGGFLIGGILGALAGLLFAPKSGEELSRAQAKEMKRWTMRNITTEMRAENRKRSWMMHGSAPMN
jgi:gas vesicle protein